jgi:hypothetical protein
VQVWQADGRLLRGSLLRTVGIRLVGVSLLAILLPFDLDHFFGISGDGPLIIVNAAGPLAWGPALQRYLRTRRALRRPSCAVTDERGIGVTGWRGHFSLVDQADAAEQGGHYVGWTSIFSFARFGDRFYLYLACGEIVRLEGTGLRRADRDALVELLKSRIGNVKLDSWLNRRHLIDGELYGRRQIPRQSFWSTIRYLRSRRTKKRNPELPAGCRNESKRTLVGSRTICSGRSETGSLILPPKTAGPGNLEPWLQD